MYEAASKDLRMSADKRNTAVVVALVLSLTVGARLLLWLEPGSPQWEGDTLLMAQRGGAVQQIDVHFADDRDALAEMYIDERDSLCVVYPNEEPKWWPGGPQVHLVVVGDHDQQLSQQQMAWVLGALGSLIQDSGQDLLPVRLADSATGPGLPPQAADLRSLLERKGIIH